MSTAWLSEAIVPRESYARLINAQPADGHSGTTSRCRFHLEWNEQGVAAGLPTSVFIKATSESKRNRAMVAALRMSSTEVDFFRTIRSSLPPATAPQCYASVKGVGGRFTLALEDLKARGCHAYSILDRCTPDHAGAVIDALALLHGTFWNSERLASDLRWIKTFSRRQGHFYLGLLDQQARRRVLSADWAQSMEPQVRDLVKQLANRAAMNSIADRGPHTVVHGDAHFGNTYANPDGTAGLLDWQLIHRRNGIQDVAHFIQGAFPVSLRRDNERDLVRRWVEGVRAAGGHPPSHEQAWQQYRLALAFEWDAVAHIVAFPGMQPVKDPARVMRRINSAVVDLNVNDAFRYATSG